MLVVVLVRIVIRILVVRAKDAVLSKAVPSASTIKLSHYVIHHTVTAVTRLFVTPSLDRRADTLVSESPTVRGASVIRHPAVHSALVVCALTVPPTLPFQKPNSIHTRSLIYHLSLP